MGSGNLISNKYHSYMIVEPAYDLGNDDDWANFIWEIFSDVKNSLGKTWEFPSTPFQLPVTGKDGWEIAYTTSLRVRLFCHGSQGHIYLSVELQDPYEENPLPIHFRNKSKAAKAFFNRLHNSPQSLQIPLSPWTSAEFDPRYIGHHIH